MASIIKLFNNKKSPECSGDFFVLYNSNSNNPDEPNDPDVPNNPDEPDDPNEPENPAEPESPNPPENEGENGDDKKPTQSESGDCDVDFGDAI